MSIHFIAIERPDHNWDVNSGHLGKTIAYVESSNDVWDVRFAAGSYWTANGQPANLKGYATADDALDALAAWGDDSIEKIPLR